MERGTAIFWMIVAVLGGASVFFATGAEERRREVQTHKSTVASGEIVKLALVVDGDTVLVQSASGQRVTVRLVGIKAFDANAKDDTGRFGQQAIDELRRLETKSIRVELNEPPLDPTGRTLATLFVDGDDVGLSLVRAGTVLVYTEYPFPALAPYLQEQGRVRGERRGIWASAEAIRRADALSRRWGVPPR